MVVSVSSKVIGNVWMISFQSLGYISFSVIFIMLSLEYAIHSDFNSNSHNEKVCLRKFNRY